MDTIQLLAFKSQSWPHAKQAKSQQQNEYILSEGIIFSISFVVLTPFAPIHPFVDAHLSNLLSAPLKISVQDLRAGECFPLLLSGWASLLSTLPLLFISDVGRMCVCVPVSLQVMGEQCLGEQCLLQSWGDSVLHHELGVPRRVRVRESPTCDKGVLECAQVVCLSTWVNAVCSTSLRATESYSENRKLWSTWYRIIEDFSSAIFLSEGVLCKFPCLSVCLYLLVLFFYVFAALPWFEGERLVLKE